MNQRSRTVDDLSRRILQHEIARRETVSDIVAAIEATFRRLHEHMFNLIGQVGFEALTFRAVHLTKSQSGWIERVTIHFEPAFTFAGLAESIEGNGVDHAVEGVRLFLANFLDLLCSFLGEELTLLLVRRIWAEPRTETADTKEGR